MNSEEDLSTIAEYIYRELIIKYNLKTVFKEKNQIIFKSDKNFALSYYFYDRSECILSYIDISITNIYSYNLLKYFFYKRRHFLPEKDETLNQHYERREYWECIFRSNANVLLEGGKDILSGDKEWLKEITWTKGFPVSPEIIPYLRG